MPPAPAAAGLTVEISERVAVVTGGASGIGRALCRALAGHGAAAVVVADIDGDGAAKVVGRPGSGRPPGPRRDRRRGAHRRRRGLVAQAQAAFGRIDLFFSNAGIIVGGGVELRDDVWSRIWAVNVHSHIALARAVLPP